MTNTPRYRVDALVAAIRESRGLVSLAARRLDCTPQTVRNYADRYPAVKQALYEAREAIKDVGENSLYRSVDEGEAWAVCFLLKTQAKDRGYVERQEATGPNGGPIQHDLRDGLTDQQRADRVVALLELVRARVTGPAAEPGGALEAPTRSADAGLPV